ncbi:MAG: 2-iminoacetate synthase ThiH [Candidatus Zapsychrus exili]|nr:2-iminoacetate synthase ThiH [Candidatus Zapsychrus exili]
MIDLQELKSILNNDDPQYIESLAKKAKKLTEQYFGRTISLYTPLYLSNYCNSHCTYCGFNSHNKMKRFKLTPEQTKQEMSYIANKGIENILLLTGESHKITPLPYLKEAVKIAKNYFPNISLEVYPMESHEYKELFLSGVDGITIYQETYDKDRYKELHISGKKADYNYRRETPYRAAFAGIRYISMGVLLGLSNIAEDVYCLYQHLKEMERNFPGIEYSLSFPRLRTVKGENLSFCDVDDITLVKIICLTRILFPRIGINLSTRENKNLRDKALGLGVTRISAESNTSVGGYTLETPQEQSPQFDIKDNRTTKEIIELLKKQNFDPVLTDWRRIKNEVA